MIEIKTGLLCCMKTWTVSLRCLKISGLLLLICVWLCYIYRPTIIIGFSYLKMIVSMLLNDHLRQKESEFVSTQIEYRLHEMEMMFNQKWCQMYPPQETRVAWLTAMMNDNYVVGAVALGFMLSKLSCQRKMIVLVSDGVTKASQVALQHAGFDVRVVESLDCDWMDRRFGRKERHRWKPGTHMRFHAWNYTEYKYMVYLDPDVIPMGNIDDIFTIETDLAGIHTRKPGVVRGEFNAGFLLFKPSEENYLHIMREWEFEKAIVCLDDQRLLNQIYENKWYELPFSHNVRMNMFEDRVNWLYHPIKFYHYTTSKGKPWKKKAASTKEIRSFQGPLLNTEDMHILWWKYFNVALKDYKLQNWFTVIKPTLS